MSCSRFEEWLDDRADGVLPADRLHALEAHLAGCERCRRALAEQRALRRAVEGLPRDVPPERDLFPAIRAAIERGAPQATAATRPRKAAWIGWAGVAASLVIVSAVALAMLWPERPAPGERAGSVGLPSRDALPAAGPDDFRAVEREYERASAALLASIERTPGRLAPATEAALRKNLAVIDGALAEIREALEADPYDADNLRLLASIHGDKIELLWRVSRLSS